MFSLGTLGYVMVRRWLLLGSVPEMRVLVHKLPREYICAPLVLVSGMIAEVVVTQKGGGAQRCSKSRSACKYLHASQLPASLGAQVHRQHMFVPYSFLLNRLEVTVPSRAAVQWCPVPQTHP